MKTVYVLLFMSCLSIFSAAEQGGKKCNNLPITLLNGGIKNEAPNKSQTPSNNGPEFSAINFFIINF